jgi:hypothetical protein
MVHSSKDLDNGFLFYNPANEAPIPLPLHTLRDGVEVKHADRQKAAIRCEIDPNWRQPEEAAPNRAGRPRVRSKLWQRV